MSIVLTNVFNPKSTFTDISPNTVINSPLSLLLALNKVSNDLNTIYPNSLEEFKKILLLIYSYLGILNACLTNIQLRLRHQQLLDIATKLKTFHGYYSIHSYWKNRYKVFYTNTNPDVANILHKYTIVVPLMVKRLTSVFLKRTIFFDRHYFNIQSSKYRIIQLNMLYFDSEYKNFVNAMVLNAFGSDQNKMYTSPTGQKKKAHRIIGEVHTPPNQLARYINKQNLNWQVVHPPLDFGYYYITNSVLNKSIECIFQNRYYNGMTESMLYPRDENGDYYFTFSIKDNTGSTVRIPQKFRYEPKLLLHLWPSPRNIELSLLLQSTEDILIYKQFKRINSLYYLFDNDYSKPKMPNIYIGHSNYRSWLYSLLHRGIYTQLSISKLDGLKLNPAWYSHAYVPYDNFRGVYKNIAVGELNRIDPSEILTRPSVLNADDRITELIDITTRSADVNLFGTANEALNITRVLTDLYGYDSQFELNYDNEFYNDIKIDYNQYLTLSNVVITPSHPTDPDFNAELRLNNANSLFLKKYYHPNRYICIADKTIPLINGGYQNILSDHISLLKIATFGIDPRYFTGDELLQDNYVVALRKYISAIKYNIWNWSSIISAYNAMYAANAYRNSVNSNGYNPLRQYGSNDYYPNSNYDLTILGNVQTYLNTYFNNTYQNWVLYIDLELNSSGSVLSQYSIQTIDAARQYAKKLNWYMNSSIFNDNVRVVSWNNSLVMTSQYDDSIIDNLRSGNNNLPYLTDKLGYYNALIPNYLLSENVSIISNQLNDADYRVWKYYSNDQAITHSNTLDVSLFWNYTYSNTAFDASQGNTNLLGILYTDNNRGSNYGLMNLLGVYKISFKFKYGWQNDNNNVGYNYNNGINLLSGSFNNPNIPATFLEDINDYLDIFQNGTIKCCVLPYNGLIGIKKIKELGKISVMPLDYVNGYKRLPGFFNNLFDEYYLTKSGMCYVTLSDFKFMFDRYGQYITHINNNTLYFEYLGKSYIDALSNQVGEVKINTISNDDWVGVTLSILKNYQGNGILSWLYFLNIGNFSSYRKYIGIKLVSILLV